MPSPRPQPTAIRKARGNPGKRAMPANEPQLPSSLPAPPLWLSDGAREAWAVIGELVGPAHLRVMTEADRPALELLCETYSEWRELTAYLREIDPKTGEPRGRTYPLKTKAAGKDGGAMQYPRPEVAMLKVAAASLHKQLIEFGMTPAARTKVAALPEKPKDENDPWAKLEALGVGVERPS